MATIRAYKTKAPRLHETVWVADNATVVGDVEIAEGSSIWFGVVVRGDVNYIRIGARTNIQDNSVLHVTRETHPTVLGELVTVGHSAVLHGCTVEDRALVGIGAIVLDGAVVGREAMVGAGALVPPHMVVPARALVLGSPARVVRTLGDEEVARVERTARRYVELANEHRIEAERARGAS